MMVKLNLVNGATTQMQLENPDAFLLNPTCSGMVEKNVQNKTWEEIGKNTGIGPVDRV